MNRLINFMFRMPVELMAAGIGIFAKTVRDFQHAFDETADSLVFSSKSGARLEPVSDFDNEDISSAVSVRRQALQEYSSVDNSQSFYSTLSKGESNMFDYESNQDIDQQLGLSDKVKYVDFTIRFSKPDHEALLYEQTGFPVNYSTNSNSFAALRVSDFRRLLATQRPIPRSWQNNNHPRGNYGYDDPDNPTIYTQIPQQDEKHIEFKITKVDSSSEKKEVSEVDAIREVRDAIRNIWN